MPTGLISLALLTAGLGMIILGAAAFFAGLLGAARRIRVSAFFLMLLISGLEVENIAAGLAANLAGFPGAAAGTFLGGTSFITLGVAGLGAILVPFRVSLPRPFLLTTAFAGAPLALLGADGALSRIDGGMLIATFCVAMFTLHRSTGAVSEGDPDDDDDSRRRSHHWARLLGGLAAMTVGGELLGNGLHGVVSRFGVSSTLLGNTAIAALTEAEEIGRVAVPARRGHPDVGVANIGGTAIHFLTLNAGILAVVLPLRLDEATMRLHLPIAVAAPALYCLTLVVRGGLGRREGVFLTALYVIYIAVALRGALGMGNG
jgi:cation:H+ antiporter